MQLNKCSRSIVRNCLKQIERKNVKLRARFCTTIQSPMDYLKEQGYTNPDIIKGMMAVISNGKPSVSDLQNFGPTGLKSLAAAVEREVAVELEQKHLPDITVYILGAENSAKPVQLVGKEGSNFYDMHKKSRELSEMMECACGGIAACSTCHIILDEDVYKKLPEAEEAELDMLDLAEDLTATSRLGCQVKLCKNLDGATIRLPEHVKNLF